MHKKRKYMIIMAILAFLSIIAYLALWMLTTDYNLFPEDPIKALAMKQAIFNIIERRSYQVVAMIVAAILISTTTLVFQTLTSNRILTPSLIGFDAIFVTSQTAIVFFLSEQSLFYLNPYLNFLITASLMLVISLIMYRLILRRNKNNIIFLLLFGMILSTFSRNFANFLQTIMDPNQFQSIAMQTEVTISNMNTSIIIMVVPIMLIVLGFMIKDFKYLDIMSLGESQAIGLGVEYQKKLNVSLIYIAIAMSISTALIGPISFLGLIAVNAAREILKTYKHIHLMFMSSLIAIIALVLGQTIIIETGYLTTVTVLISMFGGLYMIYLVLKENKK